MPDRIKIPTDDQLHNCSHDKNSAAGSESNWSKISRECYLVADGLNLGTVDALRKACTDPYRLVRKTGFGAVWGVLMYGGIAGLAHKVIPILAPATVATTAIVMQDDDMSKFDRCSAAMSDYWDHPNNKDRDGTAIRNTLPSLLIDEAIIGLGCKLALGLEPRLMGLR